MEGRSLGGDEEFHPMLGVELENEELVTSGNWASNFAYLSSADAIESSCGAIAGTLCMLMDV